MNRRHALAFLALAFVACTRDNAGGTTTTGAQADKTSFTVKGSDTMVILGQRWSETYMKEHAGITIQVTGGGSGTGVAALINGTTDICESSRPMEAKEKDDLKAKQKGSVAIETKVALDALAVYVNEKNAIKEIAIPDLAKIYKGEIKNWKEVGGKDAAIVLYGRENNSGTYAYFKEHVLSKKDFAATVQTLAGTSAVVNAIKGDENGVGYGGIAYLEGIRALSVKKDAGSPAIAPSLATAQDGTYPISRFLYFYTAGEPTGNIKKFVDWVVSDAGQKIIADVGYYPLPKK
jgi:phosphate transport system substrate-binding protein